MAEMKNKEMLEGNILPTLLKLSWPIVVGMLIQTAFNVVDTIFVGRLGPDALAAMTIAFPIVFFFMAIAAGTGVGVNSLISRYLGADRKKEADNVAEHGILLAVVLYLSFSMIGLFASRPLFQLLGAEGVILDMILQFTRTFFIGSIFLFLTFICNNILRAEGDTKTPMVVMTIAAIMNIILDPIFIFGLGIIPAMGIRGAALATVLARMVASIYVIHFLLIRKKSHLEFNLKHFRFSWLLIRKIYKVGLPASLSQVIMSFSFLFLNLIIASFGTVAIATFGIMFRLESIVFMPLVGFMTAVMVMTGHNFGAKKFSRIDQIVMIASKIATAFVIFMGLLFFLFPRFWVSIFVDEVAVISLGVDILKVLPLSYLLLGIAQMIGGAFQGMGKGMFPLIFHATRMFALTIPFAYFVGIVYGAGVIAVAWGFVMSYFIVGSGSILWYVFGGWRKKTFAISQNN